MEEKKYPIYRFFAMWDQKDFESNSTSSYRMFENPLTDEEINIELEKYKKDITNKYPISLFKVCECEYIENETWTVRWFSHFTLNKFDNDTEAITSFEQFVDRKIKLNQQNGHHKGSMNLNSKEPYYCLMGAEDRYRWEVCHCEYCQKGGWTIINH